MLHTSFIELDIDALQNNLRFIKSLLKPGIKYSMVVKANAYGHGIEDLLQHIETGYVTHFSVFSIDEAMRVKKVMGPRSEIMIMGWMDNDHIAWAIENDVSFFVFTQERLLATIEKAKAMNKPALLHLELETGLHRTGFGQDELENITHIINAKRQHLVIEGLCTHYAGAESYTNYQRVMGQMNKFNALCSQLKQHNIIPKYRHTACSAALFNFPESVMDMVRIGISSYGFWPNAETKMRYLIAQNKDVDPLERILSWKSKVMSTNNVGEGSYISYGNTYLTNRPSKIATVPVGYANGYNRTLSNSGHVLVGGKRAAVVGVVNMNMMVIDVTDIDNVNVGDEVVLVGRQGDKEITVSSFSDMNNSMNYELLTRLPDTIPRKLVHSYVTVD
jgi:alanine racemase